MFSSQRLVEGRDSPQQEGSDPVSSSRPPSGYGRQKRSRSIGQLEFLPVPAPSLSSSLSHPSIGPALSLSPTQMPPSFSSSSSYSEGCTRFSTLLLRSSYFQSVESSLPPPGDAVPRRRQRCRSGSFGYLLRHGCGCVINSVSLKITRQDLFEISLVTYFFFGKEIANNLAVLANCTFSAFSTFSLTFSKTVFFNQCTVAH